MNFSQSLEQIENSVWDAPSVNSQLAQKCFELRKVPISQLTAADLRLLIGQKIGLPYLVPCALDALELNPLVDGGLYRGDLFAAVLNVPANFWSENPQLNNRLVELANELTILSQTISDELLPALAKYSYI